MEDASPQTENGFTKIANEILDALIKYRIPGEQRQCLDAILRKTYGFHKKTDYIALSQFVEMTGLKKPTVVRAIQGLLSKKIITVIKKDNKTIHLYEFNKNYSQWKPLSKKITLSKKIITVIKKDNPSLSFLSTTKDNTTKDNTTKETKEHTALKNAVGKQPTDFYLTKNKKKLTGKRLETFNQFWDVFNYKRGRAEAADSWLNISELTNTVVEKIIAAAKTEAKNRPEMILNKKTPKMAQGWLSGRRWEDEVKNETEDLKYKQPSLEEMIS